MDDDEFKFIAECMKQKRIYGKSYFDLLADIEKLDERISQLKEALEFYSDEKNYNQVWYNDDGTLACYGDDTNYLEEDESKIELDNGKRAREALEMK